MTLQNDTELANTRKKLQQLEARYEALRAGAESDPRLRELTMRSLKGTIIEFKEEIARYEARQPARQ